MNKLYSNVLNPGDFMRKAIKYRDLPMKHQGKTKQLFGFALLLLLTFFGSLSGSAQNVLINPAAEGGFELGATFAANGWSVANSANNPWIIGAVSNGSITGNAAFVSDNGATPNYSITGTCTNYFWRDITVPAGQSKIKLDFNWLCGGESTWDMWQVFVAPTSVSPVGATHPGSGANNVPAGITGATYVGNGNLQAAAVQNASFFLPPSLAGTTFRLIFVWKSDTSAGVQPPAQIDNISLISSVPGNYVSIASGDWGASTTWDIGSSPSTVDNAIVSSGHTVNINAVGQGINNLSVNGTLAFNTVASSFGVLGNATIGTSGTINVFEGTTGKTLTVVGNIINNGLIDVSVGTTTAGNLTLNGTAVQTVSGSGQFNADLIRNLTFSNTSTAIPNINWLVDNVKIANNLNITGARINLASNKLTLGNNAAAGTFTAPVGSGFLPGGKFSRWWTNSLIGTTITAAGSPTGTASSYPFLDATGVNRTMYITRTNATGAVAGELAVVYNDATTVTSNLDISDGSYPVTDRYNGNWVVSNEFTSISSSSYKIALYAQNGLVPTNGNSRIIAAASTIGGSHQNGTTLPVAQRIDVPQADLLGGALYVGINSDDVPYLSIVSGNWNASSTWNKGVVPSCVDQVVIGAGTTVTSSAFGNEAKNTVIAFGGTLIVSAGDFVNGCTLNNNPLVNNGTLTVSGGTLIINGNLMNNAGATFNQSGGEIVVDGSDGIIANSVLTGTPLVRFTANTVANLNLTGGIIRILNPHRGVSSVDAALSISQATAPNAASTNHTFIFGDGFSEIAGGNLGGFYMNLFAGAQYFSLGNVIVDSGSATNRFLRSGSSIGIRGNLTITSGEYQMATSNFVAGNIVNNGTITATALLAMGTFVPPNLIASSTAPQAISGSGVFRNSLAAPTASFNTFQVSNSSTSGLTLNVPLSVSGTLTTTVGFINTTATNLLTLGTLTAPGTLSGAPSEITYIRGPFARTIASGNLDTSFILFPVGKSTYSPVSLAPTTTEVTTMRAEAFDANAGTAGAGVTNLSANRRWSTSLDLGGFTNIKVRLGDALIASGNIPVQAASAGGTYLGAFGSTALFTAGTPNTIDAGASVVASNYTGFLSFAQSNACSGTPTPGNTISSSATICAGQTISLTLQNLTNGAGVTYQWKSSADGITYLPISGATMASLSVLPTAVTFYACDVTCSSSAVTTTSVPVQITFTNAVTSTTPATRCGVGSLSLVATGNTGSTLSWYTIAVGGTAIATGSPFVTPSINTTTDYYVQAVTSGGLEALGPISPTAQGGTTGVQTVAWDINFTVAQATQLSSVDIFPVVAGQNSAIALRSSTGTVITTVNFTTTVGGGATAQTIPLNFILTPGNYQLYPTLPSSGVTRNTTGAVYPYTSGVASITSNGFDALYFMGMYNWQFGSQCVSPRVKVVATVTSAPEVTLSATSLTTCKGSSSAAVNLTSPATDYDTFVWAPSTGVSGNSTLGWSFNPTVNTTYILTASQSTGALCSAIATPIQVNVNPIPTAITFVTAPGTVCLDQVQALTVSGGTLGVSGKIGTGTTANTTTTPFKGFWGGSKTQALYTAAELSTLGLQNGQSISSIGFVALSGTPVVLNDFTINAGFVSASTLGTSLITGANNVVLAPILYTPTTGIGNLDFPLSTSLVWDGVSNLLVETCFNNNNGGGTSLNSISLESSIVAAGLNIYYSADNTANVCSNSIAAVTSSTTRPNLRIVAQQTTSITWSPVSNLFTDAAATVAYTAGTVASTVYFKSGTAVANNYTVTATTPSNCSVSATTAIAAIDCTISYANLQSPGTANIKTCDSQTFYAQVFKEGVTEAPGQGSGITAWIGKYTANTDPATWSEANWVLATFNVQSGNNDEYQATFGPSAAGTYYVASRFNLATGAFVYGGYSATGGGLWSVSNASAVLTVEAVMAPTGVATQDFTTGQTLANFAVVGQNIIWYSAATGGTVLPASTVLVMGITYYASQTISGCESTVRLAVTAGVDLKTPGFEMTKLSYYPNPVQNQLTVEYSDAIQNVQLYNMLGQLVYNKATNASKVIVEMTDLTAGNYILKLTANGNVQSVKVIKE
ncbi:T9SS type A sorting domain-containing protein [Flavobacterium tegetincola]|uniref:T9SS type A sorting domain-containing protein n=1 Tax=Flavobacterium tegetincola TaxID=150172 RepID=UPI000409BA9C|nr:T9SS type A sorting domain-containing protein [Flavobacterium tegetincola]